MRRLERLAFEHGGLLVLLAFAMYVALAPTTIVDGDNAEFSTLGALGGGAHPSGYPLYVLILRALSWLPGVSPVHTASIATALIAAAQLAVLHAACRAWGARPLAATVTVAIYAASPWVLRMHTEAEVFALNGLAVSSILWLAAAKGPAHGVWRGVLLGLCAGLGLANHLTCVLVMPIGVLGIVRAVRESSVRTLAFSTIALAIGLSPYLYLFIALEHALAWPRPRDLEGLVAIFTRRAYGGVGGFSGSSDEVSIGGQLVLLSESMLRSWLWLPALGGLIAMVLEIVRPRGRESRAGWLALAVAFVIAGPLLALRFDVDTSAFGIYIVRRFHLLPTLLLAPAVARGIDRAWSRIAGHVRVTVRPAIAHLLAALACIAVSIPAWSGIGAIHSPALEHGIDGMLRALPPHAVVLAHGDTLYTGALYAQLAKGARPDVLFVHWTAMETPWYRKRIEQHGIAVGTTAATRIAEVTRGALAAGRPVLVDPALTVLLPGRASYPEGIFVRILPVGDRPPPIDDVLALNRRILEGIDLAYARPSASDLHAAAMNARYARWWTTLATALAAAGRTDQAAWARDVAEHLAPLP